MIINIKFIYVENQEIENYELPDIKAMKSQWENPVGNTAVIPMPSAKSPAAIAEEKSRKEKLTKSLPGKQLCQCIVLFVKK